MPWFSLEEDALSESQIVDAVERLVAEYKQRLSAKTKRVLLLPPDLTRAHSRAGYLTQLIINTDGIARYVELVFTQRERINVDNGFGAGYQATMIAKQNVQ